VEIGPERVAHSLRCPAGRLVRRNRCTAEVTIPNPTVLMMSQPPHAVTAAMAVHRRGWTQRGTWNGVPGALAVSREREEMPIVLAVVYDVLNAHPMAEERKLREYKILLTGSE